jgi:hypothetical protein
LAAGIFDPELARPRLHPADHIDLVRAVDDDGKFPLLVRVKALIRITAAAEAAEDMLLGVAGRHHGFAEIPNGPIVRNIERLRPEKLETLGDGRPIIGRSLPIMPLHLFEDETGSRIGGVRALARPTARPASGLPS